MNQFDLISNEKLGYIIRYKNKKGTTTSVSISYLLRSKDRLKYDKDIHLKILEWLEENHPELII